MCNWGNEPDWSDAATVVEMAYPKPTPGREFGEVCAGERLGDASAEAESGAS